MERTQIMLDEEQKNILKKIAEQKNKSFSELVRDMLDEQIGQHKKSKLATAARALLADYETDEDLVAFNALDGEDLHE